MKQNPASLRLTLLGVGAMNSPRYAPAGLLVEHGRSRVIIDGGLQGKSGITAWLVTDERSGLIGAIRALAHANGLEPRVAALRSDNLLIQPRTVVHTSHLTFGYLIRACGKKVAWAPEFLVFPPWARNADLVFAEAAGWKRPIRFRGGVGGHACVDLVIRDALNYKVKQLVFSHIGRPTIKAIDAGQRPGFGEYGADGDSYSLRGDGTFFRRARIKH